MSALTTEVSPPATTPAEAAPERVAPLPHDGEAPPALAAQETIPGTNAPQAADLPKAPVSPPAPRAPVARLLPLAAAAAAVCAFGAGWIVSDGVGAAAASAERQATLQRMEALAQTVTRLGEEVSGLREVTKAAAAAPRAPTVNLSPVVSRVETLFEASDRHHRDFGERLKLATNRLEQVEKSLAALATGSLAHSRTVAAAPNQPLPPKVLDGYKLREVYEGVAVLEDRRGYILERSRGETLPGAGRIEKIEKRAGVWTVTTEKGQISGR